MFTFLFAAVDACLTRVRCRGGSEISEQAGILADLQDVLDALEDPRLPQFQVRQLTCRQQASQSSVKPNPGSGGAGWSDIPALP